MDRRGFLKLLGAVAAAPAVAAVRRPEAPAPARPDAGKAVSGGVYSINWDMVRALRPGR